MSFFDTKLMGDLLQRMSDHNRVEKFLTTQTLSVMFSLLSFIVFGIVLLCYNLQIFFIFLAGSIFHSIWITLFLKRRKQIDYLYFEKQAKNSNKTYQFITAMQEIKLQDCEQRRRWEWEDVQAELFDANMKTLKLQQTQEAGSIFINEIKNIVITVIAARAVISGQMTLGMMLAVQYIIGQDGVGLSQGQKQRLLIARAVYKNPQYIFLDEATNALDANNERVIVENLLEFYKGKIIETGIHQELIANRKAYYDLVKNQLELGN